jgi:glutamyl-tRNA synthetase
MAPRVRFPPSPTGEPHVGNIRTALFNWLFARNQGGAFILRIEDTDRTRLVPGAQEAILDGLRWLGLTWDEGPEVGGPFGPYIQSERQAEGIYAEAARQLIASEAAYECYCPPERLDQIRKQQQAEKRPPMYDRWCRNPEQREKMRRQHPETTPVVRFRMPLEGETTVYDLIHDDITVANSTQDDLVLLKSDGFPTYHLANVVDDHMMQVTHVIRGDEWLPSTPRHVLLYRAFGWGDQMPVFVHLPLILGPDRAKLSKRHGAAGLLEYRTEGYLPETMVNFLALQGWSLDVKTELMTREDLVRGFALERIGKTAAVFNRDKLDWMNGVYIRGLSALELAERLLSYWQRVGWPTAIPQPIDREYLAAIVPLIQERLKTLAEAAGFIDFFFLDDMSWDPQMLTGKALSPEQARQALGAALARLNDQPEWGHDALEALLRPMSEELGLKTGPFFGLLRAAVTGRTVSPPLFETMEVLGRDRGLARLRGALEALA